MYDMSHRDWIDKLVGANIKINSKVFKITHIGHETIYHRELTKWERVRVWLIDLGIPINLDELRGLCGCWLALIIFGLIFVFGGASCQAAIS